MNTLKSLYFDYPGQFTFILFLLGTFFVAYLTSFIFKGILSKLVSKTTTNLDDDIVGMAEKPVYWGIVLGGLYLALTSLPQLADYSNIIGIITQVGFIIILLVASIKFSKISFSWVISAYKLKNQKAGFVLTVQKITNSLIYFLGIVFVLQAVGISISPLIASLGIGGLAVGLALQPTLSNYFSGLYVSADGFLESNDYIELDSGMRGYVVSVGWRNTTIRLWNNNLVMIPNSKIADSMITNFNEPENKSSFTVTCGASYKNDLKKVEKVALEVAEKIQKKKKYGVPTFTPLFRFYNFSDSNIEFKVILQADKYVNHYLMKHEFIRDLKAKFDKENILIAFPTQSIEFSDQILKVEINK